MTSAPDPSERLPARVRRAIELRAFLVQGSWNYRVMQGTGMAFAILPLVRHLGLRGRERDDALALHADHFNAHPYLASLALGALARLEVDRTDPETVRRFRSAIRGPLGALGDRLIWAAWLPVTAAVGLLLHWSGTAGVWAVAAFVVLFNIVHLTVRFTGFRIGFEAGTGVGARLRDLGTRGWTERVAIVLLVLVGGVVGILVRDGATVGLDPYWAGGATLAFLTGLLGGIRVWRPAAFLTVGAVAALTLLGLWTG